MNGDGRLDLATANAGSSDGSVLLNRDCNQNGIPDTCDILGGISRDGNSNAIPDECEGTPFHRGDPTSSGTTDISDGIAIFGFLFLGNPATLSCKESADTNNDGAIDISDWISLLNWLFIGGPELAAPGPTDKPCGMDIDAPGSERDLGCAEYTGCL